MVDDRQSFVMKIVIGLLGRCAGGTNDVNYSNTNEWLWKYSHDNNDSDHGVP